MERDSYPTAFRLLRFGFTERPPIGPLGAFCESLHLPVGVGHAGLPLYGGGAMRLHAPTTFWLLRSSVPRHPPEAVTGDRHNLRGHDLSLHGSGCDETAGDGGLSMARGGLSVTGTGELWKATPIFTGSLFRIVLLGAVPC